MITSNQWVLDKAKKTGLHPEQDIAVVNRSKILDNSIFRRILGSIFQRAGVWRVSPFAIVLISAAVLFVGLFYVWTRMQLVQIGYEISSLENKNMELKNRKRELLLETASLQSPRELEAKAAKFGLILPAMGKVLHVPE